VKEIRACLFAGWLRREFPDLPMVYVVRNPYLNAASRLQLGWPHTFSWLFGQPAVAEDHPEVVAAVAAARSPFARHVGAWAVDNTIALAQLRQVGLPVVMTDYQRLLTGFPGELNRVRGACGLGAVTTVPAGLAPKAAGPAVAEPFHVETFATRLGIAVADVAEARALLDGLEIGRLYGSGWTPARERLADLG
jgi:hypothetical protein